MTLSDDEFRAVAEFAAVRLEPEPMASEAYVAKVYTTMSGNLKMRRFEDDRAADLSVAVFIKALAGHMTHGQLEYAVGRAIRECEWMPTPGELLKLTANYERADYAPKLAARELVRKRNGRLRMAIYRQLEERTYPADKLEEVEDIIRDKAIEHMVLFRTLDGVLAYRTPEAIDEDFRARAEFSRQARAAEFNA